TPVVEVKRAAEEIDFEFVTRDLPKTLDSMQNGALRIRDIILSLRKFSRLDEAEMKKADIHEGLDNTLLILQHRLHRNSLEKVSANWNYSIEVIKEYDSLPLVECYPGQLNQVFFNLLNNAFDALEKTQELVPQEQESLAAANLILPPFTRGRLNDDEEKRHYPTIKIHTRMSDENHVEIRICDNGSGMTPEVRGRLFDPFFTTKPVGSGTGLGLSICYQIVVGRHGGQLKCNSQLGVGTELVMQIPIRQFNDKKI
ncbi:MAG TPA: ATP-binding protein, partial [Phormidium sp.]